MTEFQHIDFQTYTAVQEAIIVLEDMDKLPFRVSKMGSGLAAAYAARLRELATVDVDGEDGELSYEKIVTVCNQIYDMVQVLKWMWGTRCHRSPPRDEAYGSGSRGCVDRNRRLQ